MAHRCACHSAGADHACRATGENGAAKGAVRGHSVRCSGVSDLRQSACCRAGLARTGRGPCRGGTVVGAWIVPAGSRPDALSAAWPLEAVQVGAKAAGATVRILTGYVFRTILGTTGLVLAVLLSLASFIKFIGQLDDIGVGDYGLLNAIGWVLLQLPTIVAQMLPIAALLGALLGLGSLASRSELIVLRAAGVSPRGLARSVLATGIVLAVAGLAISLYLAPPLERYARQQRELAKFGQAGISAGESAWIRDPTTILNVIPPSEENPGGNVYVFRLGENDVLEAIGRAESVRADPDKRWFLRNYAQTRFSPAATEISLQPEALALEGVNPDLLGLTVVREATMSGATLWRYMQYLKRSGLDARSYEVAFWSRIASLVAVPLMCILAVPFVLGPLRSGGGGSRMLAGLGIGLAWFLLSRTLADGGVVWNLNPVLIAWLPAALLALVTLVVLSRTR
ncbi:MAG: LPS export ABC transporter permease LptG [Gammaproteobacteria bacterium]|nr:LPS export ABC transporter permease LptG [Gammaproteobacteria bacterium]